MKPNWHISRPKSVQSWRVELLEDECILQVGQYVYCDPGEFAADAVYSSVLPPRSIPTDVNRCFREWKVTVGPCIARVAAFPSSKERGVMVLLQPVMGMDQALEALGETAPPDTREDMAAATPLHPSEGGLLPVVLMADVLLAYPLPSKRDMGAFIIGKCIVREEKLRGMEAPTLVKEYQNLHSREDILDEPFFPSDCYQLVAVVYADGRWAATLSTSSLVLDPSSIRLNWNTVCSFFLLSLFSFHFLISLLPFHFLGSIYVSVCVFFKIKFEESQVQFLPVHCGVSRRCFVHCDCFPLFSRKE